MTLIQVRRCSESLQVKDKVESAPLVRAAPGSGRSLGSISLHRWQKSKEDVSVFRGTGLTRLSLGQPSDRAGLYGVVCSLSARMKRGTVR